MEIPQITLILVGVICVILGFVASSLINTLRDDEVLPAEDVAQAPPGGKKGRYTAIVRLWREKKTGAIVVEFGGKSYVNAVPLDEVQREVLERVAREFRGWLGIGMNNPSMKDDSVAPPAAPDHAKEPAVVSAAAPLERSTVQAPKPPVSQALKSVPGAEPAPLSSDNKSIVMQIDDILQDMIASRPAVDTQVRLFEDPQKGVMVSVDEKIYEGIDLVPDGEIQALIREAVATWEKNQ